MRYTGPKTRLCRREGINLFGSPKYQKLLQRNQNIPGMHGEKRMAKATEYGKQLREKQKAKRMFGLSEKQFRRCFDQAVRSRGVTGDILLHFLERRLDNVLFRSGIALTRMQARQFVSHGLFLLNGRRIDVPSARVKVGDKITVKDSKKASPVFKRNQEENGDHQAPKWLKANIKTLEAEIIDLPSIEDCEQGIETRLIVEFYSR